MTRERFYEEPAADDARRSAPAALRNREPIAEVLAEWLPVRGTVLEIASGSGEHAAYFAARFPALRWQPSDAQPDALASIAAWRATAALPNFLPPIALDAAAGDWRVSEAAAMLCINLAHISPWTASLGLLDGAARLLGPGAPLILYGPWLVAGEETAAGNVGFDADLKSRDPDWGLREVGAFAAEAAPRGLALRATRAMPANNLMLLLSR